MIEIGVIVSKQPDLSYDLWDVSLLENFWFWFHVIDSELICSHQLEFVDTELHHIAQLEILDLVNESTFSV